MKPLVIAHRGASAERHENTLPAYALAVEQRADMIEIDLHRTRDGAIVIVHSEELGGLRGLELYMQRTALQGFLGLLESRFGAPVEEPAGAGPESA